MEKNVKAGLNLETAAWTMYRQVRKEPFAELACGTLISDSVDDACAIAGVGRLGLDCDGRGNSFG